MGRELQAGAQGRERVRTRGLDVRRRHWAERASAEVEALVKQKWRGPDEARVEKDQSRVAVTRERWLRVWAPTRSPRGSLAGK